MKLYLIIPNELLLSSGFVGQREPNGKAKIKIGLGVPQLSEVSPVNFSCEISETKGFADLSEKLACELNRSNNHVLGASKFGIAGVKTIKLVKPMLSLQCQALCEI